MERKKLLTCLWLTGNSVGGMITRVVVLEVEKEEKEDMNYCVVLLVLFLSFFIDFEKLFGISDYLFLVPRYILFQDILSSEIEIPLLYYYFWS